jgi:23S rRNA (guanosine2251-2'-O)-methyltransferase
MHKLYVAIHDVRSAYNVGAILRTADAVGVERVYLGGVTPTPIDRFGRPRADIAKASLGAESSVPWEYTDDITSVLATLQEQGVKVIALEQDTTAVPYSDITVDSDVALVVGAEVTGLSPEVMAMCDVVAEIPMYGAKESLNVSVAAGVMLYQLRRSLECA